MLNRDIVIIVISGIVAVLVLWLEYRRQNRSRLLWRMAAGVLAVAAFACLALPLSYLQKTAHNANAVLLTEGFSTDSVDRYRGARLYTLDEAIAKAHPDLDIVWLNSVADLTNTKPALSQLDILGYGLKSYDLCNLIGIALHFHPAPTQTGMSSANWERILHFAEVLQVHGSFDNKSSKPIVLSLSGLNTRLDSVTIPAKATRLFNLSCTPKVCGRLVYNLTAKSGTDTLENEPIPFQVEPIKPVRVLVMASSPDFENRFLKNWLSKQGYPVALITRISKEKYSTDFDNMAQLTTQKISPALLQKFDVLITDLSVLRAADVAETAALKEEVSKRGLGLIVKADSEAKGRAFIENAFPLENAKGKDQKAMELQIASEPKLTAKLLLGGNYIKTVPNTRTLVTDAQGQNRASCTIFGKGKVVFTTITNTYNWALVADSLDYTTLWSVLINNTARKDNAGYHCGVEPEFPAVNEPVSLHIDGFSTLPTNVKNGTDMLSFKQDEQLPYRWAATYWPVQKGWQQLKLSAKDSFWWYAFGKDDWRTLNEARKETSTRSYVEQNRVIALEGKPVSVNCKILVPKFWFWLMLLLCCTYLWIEQKL